MHYPWLAKTQQVEGEDYSSRSLTEKVFKEKKIPSNLHYHMGFLTELKDAGHHAQVGVGYTLFLPAGHFVQNMGPRVGKTGAGECHK